MKRPWQMKLWLEECHGESFHLRLSNQLTREIQTGRLQPSTMMPGSRSLAADMGVNRKTVQLVYEELESQGWLVTKPRRGTFVADVLPEQDLSAENQVLVNAAEKTRSASGLMRSISRTAMVAERVVPVANDGIPDARLIPYEVLSRAYRRAMIHASRQAKLGYGDPRGTIELRNAIRKMLNMDRYMKVSLPQVCIVRGSQMGIYLSSRLLNPENGVMVFEAQCYPPAMAAFESNGFQIVRCGLDKQGLDTNELQQILSRHQVAGVFITPHHQYPTTVTLSMERRLMLLKLSQRHQFAVIEDDYDHEFHYESRPIPPLSSLPGAENVIHIGSMSKVFAPGLRLGYLIADERFIDRAAQEVMLIDRQGNPLTELAVSELMELGEVKKHIRKVRKCYENRRNFAAQMFQQVFGEQISFDLPAGGMALWVNVSGLTENKSFNSTELKNYHVDLYDGNDEAGPSHIRFGFGALNEDEIRESVNQLASVLL
ncbi:PLP-dependent aminotransferase family protein [Photobacterium galatheae]|uniref:GntR family transcriptional regulator n=1 Tax=Photobacterium galatheae TaxID=1654360 RepID=A0A066RMH3_9GAMM|nr:PLP-dependent aminotransferase family protein [Photobacterium galatheae]KDM91630.1 GntR family transcriptional regulator [Photobacterium galatheae]MCM0149704.1 PLP-dependent aminotransferase family protein [Photobacterium galatheae]